MKYLIKGGRVIDPLNGVDEVCDILVSDGKIERVGRQINDKEARVIDAVGMIAAPGLVDMHVHLREPGREDEETVITGTRAAIRGGFTTVVAMPNTEPAVDDPERVEALKKIIERDAFSGVLITGAITIGREGKRLTDFAGMKRAGAVAVSDDGSSVDDGEIMLEVLKEAKKNSLLVIAHCEDKGLSRNGVMNQGFTATKMGLRGISKASEYERVRRDIELAKKAGARIHIAHVSCGETVDIIRRAKKAGVKVTAETAPHYFALTEECCATYDTNTKMNPPLRIVEDVKAIKEGLHDGTIDVIATDHAPHTDAEKFVEFDFAPFGIIGLETALGLAVTELVDKKVLSWSGLISKMSTNPAAILGLGKKGLTQGNDADVIIIDPNKEYTYERNAVESKSKNSPFIGWMLKAAVTHVFAGGRPVMEGRKICRS